MCGVLPNTGSSPIIQTPSQRPAIQFNPATKDSELTQIPQVKNSALQDSPNFRCPWQVLDCQLHFWPTRYKSGRWSSPQFLQSSEMSHRSQESTSLLPYIPKTTRKQLDRRDAWGKVWGKNTQSLYSPQESYSSSTFMCPPTRKLTVPHCLKLFLEFSLGRHG